MGVSNGLGANKDAGLWSLNLKTTSLHLLKHLTLESLIRCYAR